MRTENRGDVFVIHDIKSMASFSHLGRELSSANALVSREELAEFLIESGIEI